MQLFKKRQIKIDLATKAEKNYFQTFSHRKKAKTTKVKIKALNKQLITLEPFVRESLAMDGELPPVIPCRDELPELYKRLGQWQEAERVIKHCILCGAYYPSNGEEELRDLLAYQTAAETVLHFLQENRGYPQKNIYKAMREKNLDDYCLKSFIRNSEQIKKVPSDGTNKLYAK